MCAESIGSSIKCQARLRSDKIHVDLGVLIRRRVERESFRPFVMKASWLSWDQLIKGAYGNEIYVADLPRRAINYLKVTGYHTGLLLNFGSRSLEQRRFVLS